MPPFIDLTGQKFGRLTVTRLAHAGRVAKWNCRCECTGKMTIVRGSALRIGKTKSCGCLIGIVARTQKHRLLPLVGEKFGRLTVEKYEGNSRWLCRCECDRRTVTVVKTDALTGGDTRSCGCLHKDRAAARLTARRKKQAQARVGQTNGHLRCDAYIGKRGDGKTARHFFHFTCLHCTAKVEGPWDNRVQTCGCTKSGGHSYKKVQAAKREKLVGQIVQGRRVDAYVGKTEGVHRYQLTCLHCEKKAFLASSQMKRKCMCRLRRTEEQEILRRMDRRLRARWDTDLKRSGLEKPNGSAFSWCGYTSQQLWAHIEANLLPGMTRENRHLWHIDHIRPLKSAETLAEKKKLFALSNLQPMWASDNMSKGAKSMAEWQKQARRRTTSDTMKPAISTGAAVPLKHE